VEVEKEEWNTKAKMFLDETQQKCSFAGPAASEGNGVLRGLRREYERSFAVANERLGFSEAEALWDTAGFGPTTVQQPH
jgi:hypothetical protein